MAAPAAPALLDVPLLLSGGQPAAGSSSSTAPASLRLQLGQLAAESFEQPEDASAGFVSLRQLSSGGEEGSVKGQHLAAPMPLQLAEPPPAPALPGFLLHPAQAAGDGSASADTSPRQSALFFTLDAPVLPTDGAARTAGPAVGAPTSAFAHLFVPVDVPVVAMAHCFAPEGCQPVSLASLIAQDMLLEDGGGLLLPDVLMGEDAGREAQSGGCCFSIHGCNPQYLHSGCMLHGRTAGNLSLSLPFTCACGVQVWRCCPSSSLSAAASPPALHTWRSTWTGG